MKNGNLFNEMKVYINSFPNGRLIERKNMIEYLIHLDLLLVFLETGKPYTSSMDCYRNMLEKCGYLKKTEVNGIYEKVRNIPDKMNVSKLKHDYSNRKKN